MLSAYPHIYISYLNTLYLKVVCIYLFFIFPPLQTIKQNLKPASAGIVSLKESAHTLLQRLPTAEAKVHSQDQLLLLNERYER